MPHYIHSHGFTPVRQHSVKRAVPDGSGTCNASLVSSSSSGPAPSLGTGIPLSFLTPSVPSSSSPSKSPSSMRISKDEIPAVEHFHALRMHVVIVPPTNGTPPLVEKEQEEEESQTPKHLEKSHLQHLTSLQDSRSSSGERPPHPPGTKTHDTHGGREGRPHPLHGVEKALPSVEGKKKTSHAPDGFPVGMSSSSSVMAPTWDTEEHDHGDDRTRQRPPAEGALSQTRTALPCDVLPKRACAIPPPVAPSARAPRETPPLHHHHHHHHALPPHPLRPSLERNESTADNPIHDQEETKRPSPMPPPPPPLPSHASPLHSLPSATVKAKERHHTLPPSTASLSSPTLPLPLVPSSARPPPGEVVDTSVGLFSADGVVTRSPPEAQDPLTDIGGLSSQAMNAMGTLEEWLDTPALLPSPPLSLPPARGGGGAAAAHHGGHHLLRHLPAPRPPPPLLEEYLREEVERQQHHRRVREREVAKRKVLRETYRRQRRGQRAQSAAFLPMRGEKEEGGAEETTEQEERPPPTSSAPLAEAVSTRDEHHGQEGIRHFPLAVSPSAVVGHTALSKGTPPLSHGPPQVTEATRLSKKEIRQRRRAAKRAHHGKGEGKTPEALRIPKVWEEEGRASPLGTRDDLILPIPPLPSPTAVRATVPGSNFSPLPPKEMHPAAAPRPVSASPSSLPTSHPNYKDEEESAAAAGGGTLPLTPRRSSHCPVEEKPVNVLPFSPVFIRRHVQAVVRGPT